MIHKIRSLVTKVSCIKPNVNYLQLTTSESQKLRERLWISNKLKNCCH